MAIQSRDIIQDALETLGVISCGEPMPSDDLSRGWRTLKTMCGGWRREGVDIQELSSPFDDIIDEITTDIDEDGIDDNLSENQDIAECLSTNLAVRLSPKYGVTIDQITLELARRGEETLKRNALKKYMTEDKPLEVAKLVNNRTSYDIMAG